MRSSRRDNWIAIMAVAAVLMILFGGYQVYLAFSGAYNSLSEEYNDHLLDLAWSVDRNTEHLLSDVWEDMEREIYREDRGNVSDAADENAIREYLCALPISRKDHITAVLAISPAGEIYDNCTGDRAAVYTFPGGWSTETPSLCVDDRGENYLAVVIPDRAGALHYAALIDPAEFYREVAGEDLANSYWLTLYDETTGLFLQNNRHEPEIRRFTPAEAGRRQDGISILAAGEQSGQVDTRAYSYTDEEGVTTDNLMAVIPSGRSHNRVFAVGVAMNREHLAMMLTGIFSRIVLFAILALLGIVILLVILLYRRRTNAEMREHVALLEEQNKAMETIAHHQRLEMIGTMTGSIAHEFNNLLTPIMGYSIMTLEHLPEGCDEELLENLSEIYNASRRAKTMISRLSDLSRKNVTGNNRNFSPDTLVKKVIDMARPSLPPRVEIRTDLCCPAECLFADETQIGQLLLNLVINAFQAMEARGGVLTIATAQAGQSIVFTVKDTGPGIPPADLGRLFDPFFTTKEMGKGTGLGLAIAQQIAQEHGGTITAESRENDGARFVVTLPAGKPS